MCVRGALAPCIEAVGSSQVGTIHTTRRSLQSLARHDPSLRRRPGLGAGDGRVWREVRSLRDPVINGQPVLQQLWNALLKQVGVARLRDRFGRMRQVAASQPAHALAMKGTPTLQPRPATPLALAEE
jgi:hypothetical protein